MEWILLAVALLLVVVCALFVAAEFSFVTVDRPTINAEAETGNRRALGVTKALKHLSTQLSGAQIGITVTNLAIGFLAQPSIATLIAPVIADFGWSESTVTALSVVIGLTLATAVTMIFGELVPKNIALALPLSTAKAVQGFQRGFSQAARPAIHVLNGSANLVLKLFGVEPQEELRSARSPQELSSLVKRSEQLGTLDEATATLLERTLMFGERCADDIMTPRMRTTFIEGSAPASEVVELATKTGNSRFPVIGESTDDIIGIAHIKHVVGMTHDERLTTPVRDVCAPPTTVPDSLDLDQLLGRLRSEGLQMAVVVDEFGGTAGVVTLEDVIEELVGEIVDEHDRLGAQAGKRPDGSWFLSGLLRPDEASEITGLQLPEDDDYSTIAGLLLDRLGQMPEIGDLVTLDRIRSLDSTIDADGDETYEWFAVDLRVERLDGYRIDRIVLTQRPIQRPTGRMAEDDRSEPNGGDDS
ncbi:MAG: hemolysin family protein [Candidatus Nanopelagicales bacterium]